MTAIERLRGLPRSERREALETFISDELRTALWMEDDEQLDPGVNYFDLGMTSLRLVEFKQRLEAQLGCAIDTAAVFEEPTVAQLTDRLARTVVSELFAPAAVPHDR